MSTSALSFSGWTTTGAAVDAVPKRRIRPRGEPEEDRGRLGLIRKYSVNPDFRYVDLATELEARELFRLSGRQVLTGPELVQPVDDWIESLHSHGSLSRARLGGDATRAFDDAAGALAARDGGKVRRKSRTTVIWGRPRGAPPEVR